jgi:hypothetical protein
MIMCDSCVAGARKQSGAHDFATAVARAGLAVGMLAIIGTAGIAATAVAAPQQVAELALHAIPSHAKWIPKEKPLLGAYIASGDGEASGAVSGHLVWDLYEDQTREDRHPTFFRGILERGGRRYPFEIVGLYSPASADKKRWRISGAITFADNTVLGTEQQPMIGTFEVSSLTARFTIWAEKDAQ